MHEHTRIHYFEGGWGFYILCRTICVGNLDKEAITMIANSYGNMRWAIWPNPDAIKISKRRKCSNSRIIF